MNLHHYALIVAGGSGTRMNAPIAKQYVELNGLPIIMHTIRAFHTCDPNIKIILVLPAQDFEKWKMMCEKYRFSVDLQLAEGGKSRFQSVRNGLSLIKEENAIVAVHDGVRPLVSHKLINTAFSTAAEKGTAVAAVALKDSVRIIQDNKTSAVNRDKYRLIQTPQTFSFSILKKAYESAQHENFTDDASVVEAIGASIQLIEGDYRNIKITTKEDLDIAACFLNSATE